MEANFLLNNKNEEEEQKFTHEDESIAVWVIPDLFLFLYYLTFLVILLKQHKDHLQPVHVLTLNTLVDIITEIFVDIIHESLELLTGEGLRLMVMFNNLFLGFWFSFDLIAQDLDGFLFIYLDAYYYEWITNKVSVAIIIIIKIFGIIIVGRTYFHQWFQSISPEEKTIKNYFFYIETLYFHAIPNTLYLLTISVIIIYMTYPKCRLSKAVAPQHNIRPSNIPIPSISDQVDEIRTLAPPKVAWQNDSQASTSSACQSKVSRPKPTAELKHSSNPSIQILEIENQQIAWQDSSLWIPSISTCVSPIFIKNMKKYLKVNLCSFLSILLLLPVTTTIICIHYWGLQFHNWESFVENLMFFQMILYILYPYVVKLKLDKFIE